MDKIRVRFAPSPTGYLHIGGARTALFNWLFARHHDGVFILRIEDTDRERSTEEAIHAIIEAMDWLGLSWDEGPFRQMDRLDRYREEAERLLTEGKAYKCYCTPEELEERRKAAIERKETWKYDRRCLTLTEKERMACELEGRKPVIRFNCPDFGETLINDLVKGPVVFENANLDDFIMVRADGIPTYNFAVVIDDHDMDITHVIRGDDHLSNTPRQVLLYQALGYSVPEFGHLPMILGPDKTRLSKRHGATAVEAYRDEGYLPQALINYLALLGWGYGDQTIFSIDELIHKFSLDGVGKSPAVFDPAKLEWMNGVYIRELPIDVLAKMIKPFMVKAGLIPASGVEQPEDITYMQKSERGLDLSKYDDNWFRRLAEITQERLTKLSDIIGLSDFFFRRVEYQPEAVQKVLKKEGVPEVLQKVIETLSDSFDFYSEEIEKRLRGLVEQQGLKPKLVFQPIRVAITGRTVSPPLFETIELLGRDATLERIGEALHVLEISDD
ncbi:MAG: glutamate--tRNA ligase [Firmicutes bacterium]|nr:glutamate--tRNA ligase [Bacillota bacterium]